MPRTITKISAYDVRFPTSRHLDGSDAMNQAPDYSAAYALLETDAGDGLVGHGMTFTIGRGNEVCTKAIESLAALPPLHFSKVAGTGSYAYGRRGTRVSIEGGRTRKTEYVRDRLSVMHFAGYSRCPFDDSQGCMHSMRA